jgi:uncharacterized membrane protein YqiK
MEFSLLITVGVVLATLVTIGLIFTKLYVKSTKERAYVRTGMGGEKVIINGGAIVLPILQEVIPVNMNTMKIEITRKNEEALITKDRLRANVISEFYLRIKPDSSAISNAAQTLGLKTLDPSQLKSLIEGKFVDALRSVASQMEMNELHEKRSDFVQRVQETVSEDLLKNGLELESVSLTGLDQTDKEYFNPENVFDAEGLTKMTREIESRRKLRNDIERETSLQIQQKDLDTEKQSLTLRQEGEFAAMEQDKSIKIQKALQDADIMKEQIAKQQDADQARIEAEKEIAVKRIQKERSLAEEEIIKEKNIAIAGQNKQIEISEKAKAESAAKAEENEARAKEALSEEKVKTARETEQANREKALALINAQQVAEEGAIGIKVLAQTEKAAATDRADAILLEAQGKASAIKVESEANAIAYEVEAEGKRKINEAANALSPAQIQMKIQLAIVEALPQIIANAVKPMENIDSIKIVEMNGVNGMSGSGAEGSNGSSASLPDQIVNSALKYKTNLPILNSLLQEVGLDLNSVAGMTAPLITKEVSEKMVEDVVEEVQVTEPVETIKEPALDNIGNKFNNH